MARGWSTSATAPAGSTAAQDLPQLGYQNPATATRVTMAVGDLTGDGRPEIVISDAVNQAVMVYRNTSAGRHVRVAATPSASSPPPSGPHLHQPGRTPFLVGTTGDDVLVGTSGRDVLSGRGGDDCLFGLASDDRLSGGTGEDLLNGSSGDDRMKGDAGADKFKGGNGNDGSPPGPARTRSRPEAATTNLGPRRGTRHHRLRRRARQGDRRSQRPDRPELRTSETALAHPWRARGSATPSNASREVRDGV